MNHCLCQEGEVGYGIEEGVSYTLYGNYDGHDNHWNPGDDVSCEDSTKDLN